MATEMIDIGYDPLDHIPKRFHRHGALLASENERRILRTIWDLPGITRAELGDHIGLTQQSIHRLLVQLADDGLVTIGAV
ncbi:MAG: winged helix-turn-helix transcriptional regulator, partial [Pseudomonadota bacterium]